MSENVIQMSLEKALSGRYLRYANDVITERALPDARTGLKPVVRKTLFDMNTLGLKHNAKPKKCARVVGDTLGKYHPHGDQSCYEALVGVSQDWNMRYPLITMDCNNGSIDGDPRAAMRYTECKLSKFGDLLLKDIDKDTVDFVENYDGTETEPVVLPGIFPGLLANGTNGIAVGMATNIPPHNLTEIYEACIFMIDRVLEDKDYSLDEIMNYIKAPDFPWGGVITNTKNLKQAYSTGKGSVDVRCKYEITEDMHNGRKFPCIKITEIPYKENKAAIIEKIEQLANENKIEGILEVIDQTSKKDVQGVNIAIFLKKHADPELVAAKLLKGTRLQKKVSFNMNVLVEGHPKTVSLIDILDVFVGESLNIIVRRSQYEYNTIAKKTHILEAILKINENRERAIEILLESETPKETLISEFELSEEQANYIYNLKIRELNNTNIEKVNSEYLSLIEKAESLMEIIENQPVALRKLREEIVELKEEYGDERRTTFDFNSKNITEEDLIKDESLVITMTSEGIIKSVSADEYTSQKRGGKGVKAGNTKDEELILHTFSVNSKDTILFLTNKGNGHLLKAYKINKVARGAKGRHVSNYLSLDIGEEIVSTVAITKDSDNPYIVFVTKTGLIKKLHVERLPKRKGGSCKVITLKNEDEIVGAKLAGENDEIVIATHNGLATRYSLDLVKNTGRSARGMKGMKLKDDDYVIGFIIVDSEAEYLATFTNTGYGKKTKLDEFAALIKRGGVGVKAHKLGTNTFLVDIVGVKADDDVLITTTANSLIRISSEELSEFSRTAGGSKVVFLENDQDIKNVSVLRNNILKETEEAE